MTTSKNNRSKQEESSISVKKESTWFGLTAVAEVKQGHWHRAGYGSFILPHPPVVNLLLRRNLERNDYQTLSALHEIGHLKMLPIELLYAAIMFGLLFYNEQVSVLDFSLVLTSCFCVWEMLAESHTIKVSPHRYRLSYTNVSVFPRVIFWATTTVFMLIGWGVVLEIL